MKKNFTPLLFVAWLFTLNSLWAQGSLSGVVRDATGQTVIGASVVVIGTQLGAASDLDGNYKIANIPVGTHRIRLSYTGYKENIQTVSITQNRNTVMDIVMEEDNLKLEEIVVTGYSVQRRRDLVGSVAKIKSDKLNEVVGGSFENALQGKAAGVQITQSSGIAGAGSVIRVRGVASLSAGGDPLIVIDGIPIFQNPFVTGNSNGQNTNPLNFLNPGDIESVEILMDASATAIYGSRGANGVILVTTKRGKSGKPAFEFQTRLGFARPTKRIKLLNAEEWLQVRQEAWENDGHAGRAPLPKNLSYDDIKNINTDWLDQVLQTGIKSEYDLSMTHGGNKFNGFYSLGYSNSESYLIGNTFKRLTGRVNLDYKPFKKLTVSLNTSLARGTNERIDQAWAGGLGTAQTAALPIYPVLKSEFPTTSPNFANSGFYNIDENPVAKREGTDNHVREWRSVNNLTITVKPAEHWSWSTQANFEFANIGEYYYQSPEYKGPNDNFSDRRNIYVRNRSAFSTLSYDVPMKSEHHHLTAMAGLEYQRTDVTGKYRKYDGVLGLLYTDPAKDPDYYEVKDSSDYDIDEILFASVFGRLRYDFKGKYYVQGTFRRDASSKFGPNNRFGNFPSIGVGYIVSEESWFPKKGLSYLKLKSSWGLTGNSDFTWREQFAGYSQGSSTFSDAYNGLPVRYKYKVENPDLRWETTATTDAGIELGLFNDRIMFDITAYNKISSDVLVFLPTAGSAGLPQDGDRYKNLENVAKVRNRGLELGLKTQNIFRKNFNWTTQFYIAFNRNKVLDVATATPDALDGGFGDTRVVEGETYQNNFIVPFVRVDPATGKPIYLDANGNETFVYDVVNNRRVVGTAQPDYFGSINNSFRVKNFDIGFLWVFQVGGTIYDDAAKRQLGVVTDWNMRPDIFNRWQKPGDVADFPRLTMSMINWGGNDNFWQNNHSLWLYDATYARLRNVNIGYTFPQRMAGKLRELRLSVSASNLITLTNYIGWDPEVSRDRERPQERNLGGTGVTYLTAPQEKSVTVGLNVKF